MLLLVTIGLVLVGAISLVIGFVSSSLAPIYLSIACSILAGAVLVVFSRMSRRQAAPAGGGPAPLEAPTAAAAPAGTEVVGAATQTSAPVVPDLPFPIEDYDSLKVNEIVPLLPELDLDELDLVREREEQGRNRATILKRIDELTAELEAEEERLASEAVPGAAAAPAAPVEEPTVATAAVTATGGFPVDDYDSLSVAQVLPLLPELDDDELETVAEYEETHKNRAQILRRIDEIFETGEVAGPAAEKLGVPAAPAATKKAAAGKKAATKKAAGKKAATKKAAAPAKKAAAGGAKKAAAPAKKAAGKKAAAGGTKKAATKKAAGGAKKAAAGGAKKAGTKKAAPAKKAAKKR